jgi:hypothetical protein
MKKLTAKGVRCPRCGRTTVRRSARQGLERLWSLLTLYPFRCEACNARFKAFALGKRKGTTQPGSPSWPGMGKTRGVAERAEDGEAKRSRLSEAEQDATENR